MYRYIFTITGGRTGTAWLADFLGVNLRTVSIHEHLGIDDFGSKMPDIRTMRSFNDRGMDAVVTGFWQRKLTGLLEYDAYAETNHTLAKCGLVESVDKWKAGGQTLFVVLTRDRLKQCLSYLMRGDFVNITMDWQWYLSPHYKNVIVDPKPFLPHGQLGRVVWYMHEMECRQQYYIRLYGDRLNFIEVALEDITTQKGADKFLQSLGVAGAAILPPKANVGISDINEKMRDYVADFMAKTRIDTDETINAYLAKNSRLA